MRYLAVATVVVSLGLLTACDDPVAPADHPSEAAPVLEWAFDNPPYQNLYDLSGATAEAMVAVGAGGTILRRANGDWVDLGPTPLSGRVGGVWSASASELFAVDYTSDPYSSRIHRYRDGEWTTWELDDRCVPVDVWGASSSDVFVVSWRCGIYHFDGTGWSQVADHAGYRMDGRAADDVYVVGSYEGVFHYDGSGWTAVDLPAGVADAMFWDVWAAPSGDVWLVGETGTVVRFDGSSWVVVDVGASPDLDLVAVWGSGSDVFMGGYSGTMFHYDGADWTSAPLPGPIESIAGTGPGDVWAVGSAGRIYHFDGSAWSTVREGRNETLMAVRGSSGSDVYAAGGATVLHNNGTGWTDALPAAQVETSVRALWVDGPAEVFMVGNGNEPILHYDGTDWAPMNSPVEALDGVWGASATDVFAVGPQGTVIHYDGAGWTGMSAGTDRHLLGVWGASATDVFAVGDYTPEEPEQSGILRFDGQAWEGSVVAHMSHLLEGAWGTGPDDVYAVGDDGLILHWDGDRWQEQDSGTSADLKDVWGDASDNVYAVGAYGTVVHYDGSAWTPVTIPHTLASTLHGVWLGEDSDVVIVGDAGVVLRGIR